MKRPRGLTLIELVLALAGTAIVALAVAAMVAAFAQGTDSRQAMYSLVAQSKASTSRLTAAIRGSRQVLALSDTAIVLWLADDDGDGLPALAEIRRIDHNPAAATLIAYAAAPGAAPAVYAADADFLAITDALLGTTRFPAELWATDVTDWQVTLDTAQPADAHLVGLQLSLRQGDITEVALAAAALRNRP